MRYLSLGEVLLLHQRLLDQAGGGQGLRDLGALEAAVAQPRMTFGGDDLYPDLAAKAGALGYSLIQNHPFFDGNKRVGHAAIETVLILNGWELGTSVEDAEDTIVAVASGQLTRDDLTTWIARSLRAFSA